ncbi:hypothetical protein [Paracoccus sp. (in: a-proteobacteria)]|uniref:hypothetical protein n=1 Tax=Paracoccus sp. TaxID=267 RepID=UPI00396D028B
MPHFEHLGIKGGRWRGRLHDLSAEPLRVVVVQHGEVVCDARLLPEEGSCLVEADLPGHVLCEGMQTLLLRVDGRGDGGEPPTEGEVLARLPLLTGRPLDDDLLAEITALRAELELVKRELRRFAADHAGRSPA